MTQGNALAAAGAYAAALEVTRRGSVIADEIEHLQWMAGSRCTMGLILLDILNFSRAREYLERARALARSSGSMVWRLFAAGTLGAALTGEGNLAQASAVLDEALPQDAPIHSLAQRFVWRGRAELALARREPGEALRMTDQLYASTPQTERGMALVILIRARALTGLEQWDDAEAEGRRAIARALQEGRLGIRWRAQICLGNILRAQRRTGEADAAYGEARTLITRIVASLSDPDLRGAFDRESRKLLPRDATPERRAEAERFGGLTAREREVARLVTQGMSNRTIAGELVVSERTVETHVTNILLKLGFTSRAQVAAWVERVGLPGG
jgi:ATP/maltotriose-dependent transcriptional regulator MalT